MATFVQFECLSENIAEEAHKFDTDTLTVALSNVQPTAATNTVLTDITEIAYTNLSSRTLTTGTSRTGATTTVTCNDLILSASGGAVATFQYAVVYNSTNVSNPLIGYYDVGATTLQDGDSLTLDFGANGLLTIA